MKRWMRRTAAGLLAAGIIVSLAACGVGGDSRDLSRQVKPQPLGQSEGLDDAGAQAMTDFGVRLLQEVDEPGSSTLISPLSVLTALSMTANGAEKETLEEMEQVLGLPTAQLNEYLHAYLTGLPEGKDYHLRPANSIWFTDRGEFQVDPDFIQRSVDYYSANLYQGPLDDSACRDINRWVKDKTEGMIPQVLDRIPENAMMYLINALAFEGEWPEPYREDQVGEAPFHLEDGTGKQVELMYGEDYLYLENDHATGFIKPYKGGKYAFAALLPREGETVEELLDALTGEELRRLLKEPDEETVFTAIPKFKTEYGTELSETLKAMGMPRVFDPERAQLEKLGRFDGGNLYVSQVIHKTFLEMGEKGTRAAAVTAIEACGEGAAEEEPKVVKLDRPFLYMLVDCENSVPFFLGIMREPMA